MFLGSKDKPEEDEQKIKARMEKTRLKVQAWRKKQRENKAKHEELKRVDKERRTDARLLKKTAITFRFKSSTRIKKEKT